MSSETVKGTSTLAAASMEEGNKTIDSSPLANQVVTSGTIATSRSKVMPTNQNEATATPPPSLATTKESSALKASSSIEGKRLIRTIRPIDVRKLQQAGLDRKIAEALSKQKQKQTKLNKSTAAGIVKVSSSSANITPTHVKFMKPIATLSVSSSSMASASPLPGTEPKQPPLQPQPPAAQGMPYVLNPTSRTASTTAISSTSPPSLTVTAASSPKTSLTIKSIIPPKITITGPETNSSNESSTPTEEEIKDLTPEQRMKHVKSLLHKKLLQRQTSYVMNVDGQRLYTHLKTPTNESPPPPASLQKTKMNKSILQIPERTSPQTTTPTSSASAEIRVIKEGQMTPKIPTKPRILNSNQQQQPRILNSTLQVKQITQEANKPRILNNLPKHQLQHFSQDYALYSSSSNTNNNKHWNPHSLQTEDIHYNQQTAATSSWGQQSIYNKHFSYVTANVNVNSSPKLMNTNVSSISTPNYLTHSSVSHQQQQQQFHDLNKAPEMLYDKQWLTKQDTSKTIMDRSQNNHYSTVDKHVMQTSLSGGQRSYLQKSIPRTEQGHFCAINANNNYSNLDKPYTQSPPPLISQRFNSNSPQTNQRLDEVSTISNKSLGQSIPTKAFMRTGANVYANIIKLPPQTPLVNVRNAVSFGDSTPSNKLSTKPKTPQKSPQDIARKLDFETEECITHYNSTAVVSTTPTSTITTRPVLSGNGHEFPKASVKLNLHTTPSSPQMTGNSKHRIVIPDVSPLKTPFPSANLPQGTPLPNIDIFKKPLSLPSSSNSYYQVPTTIMGPNTGLISTNYHIQQSTETSPSISMQLEKDPAYNVTPVVSINTPTTVAPNSLIVLENKVLSQDEMIDLTALRLSTTKIDAPQRFARPHKPIPEVVIKQENPDEFTPAGESAQQQQTMKNNSQQTAKKNSEEIPTLDANSTAANKSLILTSSKQNKKIIVNASKLKLPPGKIADLARKIAERAASQNLSGEKKNTIENIVVKSEENTAKESENKEIVPHATFHDGNNVPGAEKSMLDEGTKKASTTDIIQHLPVNKEQTPQQIYRNFILNATTTPQQQENPANTLGKKYFLIVKKEPNKQATTTTDIKATPLVVAKEKESPKEFNKKIKQLPQIESLLKDSEVPFASELSFKYSPVKNRQPAVEILDEPPDEVEDNFSAVDFIASLAHSKPITEETQLELSPEELNLNASCAMNLSPLRIPFSPRKTKMSTPLQRKQITTPEVAGTSHHHDKSVEIGNIVTLKNDNNNIVHISAENFTMSEDTIVIESSRGRDHVLRKSIDVSPCCPTPNRETQQFSPEIFEENLSNTPQQDQTFSEGCGDLSKNSKLAEDDIFVENVNTYSSRPSNEDSLEAAENLKNSLSYQEIPRKPEAIELTKAINLAVPSKQNTESGVKEAHMQKLSEELPRKHTPQIKIVSPSKLSPIKKTLKSTPTKAFNKATEEKLYLNDKPEMPVDKPNNVEDFLADETMAYNKTSKESNDSLEIIANNQITLHSMTPKESAEPNKEENNAEIRSTTLIKSTNKTTNLKSILKVSSSSSTPIDVEPKSSIAESNVMDISATESIAVPSEDKAKSAENKSSLENKSSKRISRFKKGKINLVQRSKPSAAGGTAKKSAGKFDETKMEELKSNESSKEKELKITSEEDTSSKISSEIEASAMSEDAQNSVQSVGTNKMESIENLKATEEIEVSPEITDKTSVSNEKCSEEVFKDNSTEFKETSTISEDNTVKEFGETTCANDEFSKESKEVVCQDVQNIGANESITSEQSLKALSEEINSEISSTPQEESIENLYTKSKDTQSTIEEISSDIAANSNTLNKEKIAKVVHDEAEEMLKLSTDKEDKISEKDITKIQMEQSCINHGETDFLKISNNVSITKESVNQTEIMEELKTPIEDQLVKETVTQAANIVHSKTLSNVQIPTVSPTNSKESIKQLGNVVVIKNANKEKTFLYTPHRKSDEFKKSTENLNVLKSQEPQMPDSTSKETKLQDEKAEALNKTTTIESMSNKIQESKKEMPFVEHLNGEPKSCTSEDALKKSNGSEVCLEKVNKAILEEDNHIAEIDTLKSNEDIDKLEPNSNTASNTCNELTEKRLSDLIKPPKIPKRNKSIGKNSEDITSTSLSSSPKKMLRLKVSLIDIVKNPPPELKENPPQIPFKRRSDPVIKSKLEELIGIRNLIQKIKKTDEYTGLNRDDEEKMDANKLEISEKEIKSTKIQEDLPKKLSKTRRHTQIVADDEVMKENSCLATTKISQHQIPLAQDAEEPKKPLQKRRKSEGDFEQAEKSSPNKVLENENKKATFTPSPISKRRSTRLGMFGVVMKSSSKSQENDNTEEIVTESREPTKPKKKQTQSLCEPVEHLHDESPTKDKENQLTAKRTRCSSKPSDNVAEHSHDESPTKDKENQLTTAKRTRCSSRPSDNVAEDLKGHQSLFDKVKQSEPDTTSITRRTRLSTKVNEVEALKINTRLSCLSPADSLDIEDSCQESTTEQGSKTPLTICKQRKKLRKTLEDIKKSHKIDTESEDDRDFDSLIGCGDEAPSDFLGFEDNSVGSASKSQMHEINNEATTPSVSTKGGTLKNWLTTGKAISPTPNKDGITKPLRQGKKPYANPAIPLKKRWEANQTPLDETDITDDSSPANDDDDDEGETLAQMKGRRNKRYLKTVIDSNKELVKAKKIRLDKGHHDDEPPTFAEPKPVTEFRETGRKAKMSETDSDTPVQMGKRVKRPRRRLISDDFNEDDGVMTEVIEPKEKFVEEVEQRIDASLELKPTNSTITTAEKKKRGRKPKYMESEMLLTETIPQKSLLSVDIDEVEGKVSMEEQNVSECFRLEETNSLNSTTTEKKKRGRKCKSYDTKPAISKEANVISEACVNESFSLTPSKEDTKCPREDLIIEKENLEETTPKPKGKRGRKRRLPNEEEKPNEKCDKNAKGNQLENMSTKCEEPPRTPSAALSIKPTTASSGGCRYRARTVENEFNPRLLLITKRQQLDSDEVLTETKPGVGPIQCGFCLKRTTEAKWQLHLSEHYGIGWKQGQQEQDILYRPSVINIIMAFLKDTEIKVLACRMCNKLFRSALGLVMHIEKCGAEIQRVDCEYCHRNYSTASLPSHLRSCSQRLKSSKPIEDDDNPEMSTDELNLSNTGRTKRHSTLKAESKLKQMGAEMLKAKEEDLPDFDPKKHIRYSAPLSEDVRKKWSKDLRKCAKCFCPKKMCSYASDKIEDLEEHIKTCRFISKSGYYCTLCRKRCFTSEKEAIDHINTAHRSGEDFSGSDSDCNIKTDDDVTSNDEDDDDVSEGVDEDECSTNDTASQNTKKKCRNPPKRTPQSPSKSSNASIVLRKRVFDKRGRDGPNAVILSKWINFMKTNHSSKPLFHSFSCLYSALNTQQHMKYLPNQEISMKFSLSRDNKLPFSIGEPQDNLEWQQIQRYQTINHGAESFMFVGAPITSIAWLPLPPDLDEQYLLVVHRKDMFKFTKFINPKHHKTSLMLFKVTQHKENGKKYPKLQLHYLVAIDDGPVYNVSFLPSGGYNLDHNRLGLVAVASVANSIKVYALPIELSKSCADSSEDVPLIEIKPCFELKLDVIAQDNAMNSTAVGGGGVGGGGHVFMNPQCLQIVWSEFSGHNHIFASFSNGCIGIWDVTNDAQENLNRFDIDGKIEYAPLNYFYVGEKGIRLFALHYDVSGPRWLAVNCFFRRFVIYDIRNFMQPIPLREDYARNIARCMEWNPLCEPILIAFCDSIPNNGRCIQCINPTNVMYQQQKLDTVISAATGIHYNPYSNMCVASVDNGDIVFMDCRELHYEQVLGRKFGERRILSSMDVKQLDGKPIERLTNNEKKEDDKLQTEWTMYDYDYKEKYGLVFRPLIKLKESLKDPYFSEHRRPPLNITPFMRINTLRCNLNRNAKRLIAVGYENGFIRVIYFDKDSQFRKW